MTTQEQINTHHAAIHILSQISMYEWSLELYLKAEPKTETNKAINAVKLIETERKLKQLRRSYEKTMNQLNKAK